MYLNFSSGDTAPLIWRHTTGVTVVTYLYDVSQNKWWDGTAWEVLPTALATPETATGLYIYTLPADQNGHFYAYMSEGVNREDFQIYLGKIVGTSDTSLCEVFGYVKDGNGQPIPNAEVNARLVPLVVDNNTGYSTKLTHVRTDSNGYFTMWLKREEKYVLNIPLVTYNKEVEVPDSASVQLEDL